MFKLLICELFGHQMKILKHLRGNINSGVRTIFCARCERCFVMNDRERAFLRIDNDESFQEDLKLIHNTDNLGLPKQPPKGNRWLV